MAPTAPPPVVAPEWLAVRLHWPHVVVLDATVELTVSDEGEDESEGEGEGEGPSVVSGRAGYLTGHVPGAVFADLLADLTAPAAAPFALPSAERFAAAAGALGVGQGRWVVVYDQGPGVWADRLWWQLRVFGFDDVAVLDGGLPAWRRGHHPVEDGEVEPRPVPFLPCLRPHLVATGPYRPALSPQGAG
jgi:thiosulfate/3-mercaptopyruvate sulfurtransferase